MIGIDPSHSDSVIKSIRQRNNFVLSRQELILSFSYRWIISLISIVVEMNLFQSKRNENDS